MMLNQTGVDLAVAHCVYAHGAIASDPAFYTAKAQLRDSLPDAILIEITPGQVMVAGEHATVFAAF